MIPMLVLLAAAAVVPNPAPTSTPQPTVPPAPTAVPRTDSAGAGLSGAAGRIRLNRAVSFDDLKQGKASPAYTPKTPPGCEALAFKKQLDGIVSRFSSGLVTAGRTPRMTLGGEISRLHGIRDELRAAGAKAPPCASEAVKLGDQWMSLEIASLNAFLAQDERGSASLSKSADDAFGQFEAERLLLGIVAR